MWCKLYRLLSSGESTCKKSLSSDNLAAAAAAADQDPRRLPVSPFRDMENDEDAQFVAAVEEMRVSPVISRQGFLYFLEENATGWIKMWVVSITLHVVASHSDATFLNTV